MLYILLIHFSFTGAHIFPPGREKLLFDLQRASETFVSEGKEGVNSIDTILFDGIRVGVAFHHAGLNAKRRELIEQAFKVGLIHILVATSTLAAGVNLPAGRVIIRSMKIGKDFLRVGQYKQMVGRAGRAGHSAIGESFLLVEKSELSNACELLKGVLPPVRSQFNTMSSGSSGGGGGGGGGKIGLLKLVIEVVALGLCETIQECLDFISFTLLYCESSVVPPSAESAASKASLSRQHMASLVMDILKVLSRVNALVISPALNSAVDSMHHEIQSMQSSSHGPSMVSGYSNKSEYMDCVKDSSSSSSSSDHYNLSTGSSILRPTQFGKALVQCGMPPDEAIVMYKYLYRAQKGLDLSSNIHLLFLVTPPDHNLVPDFGRLLKWYDHTLRNWKQNRSIVSSSSSSSIHDNNKDHFVGTLLGIEEYYYGLLERWVHQPPSGFDISRCYDMERRVCLSTSFDFLENSLETNTTSTIPSSSSSSGSSNSCHTAQRKPLSESENEFWLALSICKRLWGCLFLDELAKGKPLSILCKELSISSADGFNLQYSARIQCGRVERLCDELGWTAFTALIKQLRSTVFVTNTKGCEELLKLQGITPKLAMMLHDSGINSIASLANAVVRDVAAYLHLKTGFEPKVQQSQLFPMFLYYVVYYHYHSCFVLELNNDFILLCSQEMIPNHISDEDDECMEPKPATSKKTDDELLRARLEMWIWSLVSTARSEFTNNVNCYPIKNNQYAKS